MSRKKGHGGGHENAERWLLTYADMITLLVVFFIIMYAQARVDSSKFAAVAMSLRKGFNVQVLEGLDPPSAMPGFGASGIIRTDTLQYVSQEMDRFARSQGVGDEVGVGLAKEGVVISFSGNLLFKSGRAEVTPEGKEVLAKVAELLRDKPNFIRVEGHTDAIPFSTEEFPSNWELSSARSLAVVHYFVDEAGLPAARFSSAAYGEYRPMAGNETKEDRARNRRADVVILDSKELSSEAFSDQPTPTTSGE